jgi:hypothetical protein
VCGTVLRSCHLPQISVVEHPVHNVAEIFDREGARSKARVHAIEGGAEHCGGRSMISGRIETRANDAVPGGMVDDSVGPVEGRALKNSPGRCFAMREPMNRFVAPAAD